MKIQSWSSSKGDLNYPYFVGDRRYFYTMEKRYFFERFSRPAICLRTLKSEVLVGLPADITTRTLHLQPDWLTSGRYGIIQVFAH
ncbi:MAG: ARMT1-like domain-containing protein [Nitrosomonas sp.]|nr:ARMT1-like domain-containing protein [Nitrosomonas sp.]